MVHYEAKKVLRLMADFRRGRFAPAFPPERRATVHEPAYRTPERATLQRLPSE